MLFTVIYDYIERILLIPSNTVWSATLSKLDLTSVKQVLYMFSYVILRPEDCIAGTQNKVHVQKHAMKFKAEGRCGYM